MRGQNYKFAIGLAIVLIIALVIIVYNAHQTQAQTLNENYVLSFGDSITQGVVPETYPIELATIFTSQTGESMSVDNQGVGGSRSWNVYYTASQNISKMPDARIITIGVGYNDIGTAQFLAASHRDVPKAYYYNTAYNYFVAYYDATLKMIHDNAGPNTTVLLRNNFISNPAIPNPYFRAYIYYVNAHIKAQADAYGWPVYDMATDFNGACYCAYIPASLLSLDGIHPSALGNTKIAQGLANLGFSANVTDATPTRASALMAVSKAHHKHHRHKHHR